MNSKELNKRLKDNITDNIYLFFGEEDYIKDTYISRIKNILLKDDFSGLNYIQYDEIPNLNDFTDAVESVPVMCEHKIILLNSLNLISATLKKDLKNSFAEIFEDLPDYTTVIIKEASTAGKSKASPIYKIADKLGAAVECSLLEHSDMMLFINKEIGKRGKKISREDLSYLLSLCDGTINSALSESEKICSYLGENDVINRCDIDLLVKKPIEDKVFELFDYIIGRKKAEAYRALNDLKLLKNQHSPGQIFSIICDNFMNMLIVLNNTKEGISQDKTVELLDLPPNRAFVVRKLQRQSKATDAVRLKKIIHRLSEMDTKIKTGIMDPYYAIEEIIAVF